VIKSNQEIRQVLLDNDQTAQRNGTYGNIVCSPAVPCGNCCISARRRACSLLRTSDWHQSIQYHLPQQLFHPVCNCHESTPCAGSAIFGTGKAPSNETAAAKLLYEGLGVDGSPVVMNIEMNKEAALNPGGGEGKGKKGGKEGKGGKAAGAGGGGGKGKGKK
jgi:hypothetical protein